MSILIREVTRCDKFIRNILMAQVEKFCRDCKVESKKNVIFKIQRLTHTTGFMHKELRAWSDNKMVCPTFVSA